MRHIRFLVVVVTIFLPFQLSLQFGATLAAERNIVFFISDDESTTLGCYGDAVAVTPNIDDLAKDGTRFINAFATTASCSPSRSVVLSGLHNHMNGQYGLAHHFHKFTSFHNVISLALPRVLAGAGYRTAQIGKYHVTPEEVFRFETYLKGDGRNAVAMANQCETFIANQEDSRPFFLYFATEDPHRSSGQDTTSKQRLKPNLFGNLPDRKHQAGVEEVFFDPSKVPIPAFLPDTIETREELAQYYQSCSRIDQGLGRLVELLKKAGVYEKTLIVFTSDHGMAFAGAKTTVYDPGLKVPFVVRNPYETTREVVSEAMISHVDITPTLLDFAGGLDAETNGPTGWIDPNQYWQKRGVALRENRDGEHEFRSYHGRSWLNILGSSEAEHWDTIFASHTFHEIQMYYPMRVVRGRKYKLIWNIAHALPYPFASDLWAASSWQAQFQKGRETPYGQKTVAQYIQRPEFELYNIESDPNETDNLARDPNFSEVLAKYQRKLREFQAKANDPWKIGRAHV